MPKLGCSLRSDVNLFSIIEQKSPNNRSDLRELTSESCLPKELWHTFFHSLVFFFQKPQIANRNSVLKLERQLN